MMKMKSERPLLINGIPQTEFETTIQHGKELKAAGLAVPVGEEVEEKADTKMADTPENKMADAPSNKSRSKKAD